MEKFVLISCVVIFINAVAALEPEVTVRPNDKKQVHVGEPFNVSCYVNQELSYILDHSVDFYQINSWTGETRMLFVNKQRQPIADPEYYDIAFETNPNMLFTLIVKQVRDMDDGRFECRTGPKDSSISGQQVEILRPLTGIELKVGDFTVTGEEDEMIQLDAGSTVDIRCSAKGSNPSTRDVKVFVGENLLIDQTRVPEEMDGVENRQFKTKTVKQEVSVSTSHDGLKVQCNARDAMGTMLVASAPIKVMTFDPTITCEETKAYKGKRYVEFLCTVDHADMDIKGYKYLIGDKGLVFDVQGQEPITEVVEGTQFKVEKDSKSTSTQDILKMTMYEASENHFSTDFQLVVETAGDHITKQKIAFVEIPDTRTTTPGMDPNGADSATFSLATVLLSVLIAVFQLVL